MNIVTVSTRPAYDVCIGEGLLAHAGEHMRNALRPCRAAIITDTTVDALYGQTVENSLRAAGFDPVRYAFPAGEIHKRLSTLEDILEFLAESQMTRTDLVVALGGGVVGDVALPRRSTPGAFASCRFPPRCWRRWIPPWAARRRWISARARIWRAASISRRWC